MAKIANTLRRAEYAILKAERKAEARQAIRKREKKIAESHSYSIGMQYDESPEDFFAAQRVYFISAGRKAIKIGYSDDVIGRIGAIQTGNHEKLELLGCALGDVTEERRLHRKFNHHLIHNEWFHPADEIIDYVRDYCPLGDRVSLFVPSKSSPMVVDKVSGLVIRVFPFHSVACEYQARFDGVYRNLLPMKLIPFVLKKQVV